MAKQNRTTLKGYFEVGDTPSQQQYADLIDSNLNLSENNTGDITLTGEINLTGNLTASAAQFGSSTVTINGPEGQITASGNISSSGTVTANSLVGTLATAAQTNITSVGRLSGLTVQGNISASGFINTLSDITASGNIFSSGNITGETGSFNGGVILKAPNGNQFIFTINNSGHLSLTGSAI